MYHDREKHGKRIKAINNKLYLSTEMGLEALTSYKYIIYGNGQVRP